MKYKELCEYIVGKIEKGEYIAGTKLPSEHSISRQFSVSRQTVRNCFAKLESDGVIERIKGSGTFVRHSISVKEKTRKIGVLFAHADTSCCIYPFILQGLEEELAQRGYRTNISFHHGKVELERRFLMNAIEQNVDGIVMECVQSALPTPNQMYYNELKERGIPIVFVHAYYDDVSGYCVRMDDELCAYNMVSKLIYYGHKEIACISKMDDKQGHWRYKGYYKALNDAGLNVNDDHVYWYNSRDLNYEDMAQYIQNNISRISAIMVYNDRIVEELKQYLIDLGIRIPEDLSVISFDDTLENDGMFSITTVVHPKRKIGKLAVEKLIEMIEMKKEELQNMGLEEYKMKPTFKIKKSILDIRADRR